MKSLAVWYELLGGALESLACKLPCVQIGIVELGGTWEVMVGLKLILPLCCDSACET